MRISGPSYRALLIVGMLSFATCQSTGEVLETKESQSDTVSCSSCTVEHCPGAATLREGVLLVDRDQFRRRARCLGVHSEVQFYPKTKDGKIIGVTLSSVRDGSVFQSIGLQNRDVITSVNGAPVDVASLSHLLNVLGQDDDGAVVELTARRGSEGFTLRFQIG